MCPVLPFIRGLPNMVISEVWQSSPTQEKLSRVGRKNGIFDTKRAKMQAMNLDIVHPEAKACLLLGVKHP